MSVKSSTEPQPQAVPPELQKAIEEALEQVTDHAYVSGHSYEVLVGLVREALAYGARAEREECAKIIDEFECDHDECLDQMVAAIRAREAPVNTPPIPAAGPATNPSEE